ncbi:uncharacterized protein LOC109804777 isoform X2 [Cajanus cajan]|uniref:uncharacterized protein LOC109804777 isoform X2 n=1 Tax=Cajanus cajan TaxID=3821 RepID=UPI0010FAD6E5|nr:uncharacterized protein LOC109804777 isoform X2 [Cajanus cajan]
MIPHQWASPCGNQCTNKYAALTKIPWRVFCKKGCDSDGETWEECLEECDQMCYKDPVLKDQQWSAYIDRSPGAAGYSEFEVKAEEADKVCPNRKPKPKTRKPKPQPVYPNDPPGDMPGTSA